MEMHQLEYVLAVSKYRNFTRAAEEIKISQSSLSHQISLLEEELGICLFLKSNRSVRLTPSGEKFIINAKRIMTDINKVKRTDMEHLPVVDGELRLGTMAVIGYYSLRNLLSSFHESFKGINIDIVEDQCEKLLFMLSTRKIDAAFVQINKPDPNLKYYKLLTDKMVVVTNKKHRLANRESVDISELQGEKFILTPSSSGHFYDFNYACQAAGFSPIVVMTSYVAKNIVSFVSEGLGISVLSNKVAETEKDDNISIIELNPTIQRRISLAVRNTSDTPPTLKLFLDFVQQWNAAQDAFEQAKDKFLSSVLNSSIDRLAL
ncbi:LysR family transcriptional regulator [Pelotomaculum propionicicum]|uniref:LysR family transcriptional regulator n=1 Tax=Pelotomaculum propionicicum TaxID=258475 RepID=UPI003B7935C4